MYTNDDWHNMDVITAIKKKTGLSLSQLSKNYDLYQGSLQQALHRPYPKAENIIASEIGVPAKEIWPSRFNLDGSRRDQRVKNNKQRNV